MKSLNEIKINVTEMNVELGNGYAVFNAEVDGNSYKDVTVTFAVNEDGVFDVETAESNENKEFDEMFSQFYDEIMGIHSLTYFIGTALDEALDI